MKFRIIFMLIVMIGIIVAADVYIARKVGYAFKAESLKPYYWIISIAVFAMFTLFIVTNSSTSSIASVFYQISATLVGFVMYLLMFLLLFELIRVVITITPQQHFLFSLLSTIILSGYGIWNANNTIIREETITIENITSPTKIMHVTDIHLGHFRGEQYLERIVAQINEQNVDLILITGDLFDNKYLLSQKSLLPLKNLNAPAYFVHGNHDVYAGVKKVMQYVDNTGVHNLYNEVVEDKGIQIVGLSHMRADSTSNNMHTESNGKTIKSVLKELPINKEKPAIVLHHSPDGIEYVNKAGADLYLAGHTHAGQLFPATFVARLMFDYNTGMHTYKNTIINVSEGTGTFGPPMRVGTNSEMTLINLLPK